MRGQKHVPRQQTKEGEGMIKREAAIVTVSIALEGYIETCLEGDEFEEDRKSLDAAWRTIKRLSLKGDE